MGHASSSSSSSSSSWRSPIAVVAIYRRFSVAKQRIGVEMAASMVGWWQRRWWRRRRRQYIWLFVVQRNEKVVCGRFLLLLLTTKTRKKKCTEQRESLRSLLKFTRVWSTLNNGKKLRSIVSSLLTKKQQ